ncbi:T9SS type A sorting domain-containing protein [Winogradskyella luteola]|uniref:T9SS type A sorting domain-containing protein n=1 Tax=Winogradskyella luteola TaxID=2828330 RepID=A0A9X1JNI5_9FLAO|nr:T9SS type A sorting domain-containing protein [Winogradskyella luteola]MBV7267684.1 T9SS type A sorting domain-containing protein [Winogradskyella luteola]
MRTFIKFQYVLVLLICFKLSYAQGIQTVRIDFQNPEGFTRHLALGFVEDNSATDGVDYGYDAPYINDLQDDLNWMIENDRFVIQGVGAFSIQKYYPLGMFLSNAGEVTVSLNALENFENQVDVYLYDLELNSYLQLNDTDFTQSMLTGDYINRFFITFSNNVHSEISNNYLLSINDEKKNDINVWYSSQQNQIRVSDLSHNSNGRLTLYNIVGKKVKEEDISNNKNHISTSGISEGVYLVRIETPTFVYSTKVCITN